MFILLELPGFTVLVFIWCSCSVKRQELTNQRSGGWLWRRIQAWTGEQRGNLFDWLEKLLQKQSKMLPLHMTAIHKLRLGWFGLIFWRFRSVICLMYVEWRRSLEVFGVFVLILMDSWDLYGFGEGACMRMYYYVILCHEKSHGSRI